MEGLFLTGPTPSSFISYPPSPCIISSLYFPSSPSYLSLYHIFPSSHPSPPLSSYLPSPPSSLNSPPSSGPLEHEPLAGPLVQLSSVCTMPSLVYSSVCIVHCAPSQCTMQSVVCILKGEHFVECILNCEHF